MTENESAHIFFTSLRLGWPERGNSGSSISSQQQQVNRKENTAGSLAGCSPESLHACTQRAWGLRAGFPAALRSPMNSPLFGVDSFAKPTYWRTEPRLVCVCTPTHSNTNKLAHKVPLKTSRPVSVWAEEEYGPVFSSTSLDALRLSLGELSGVLQTKISSRKSKSKLCWINNFIISWRTQVFTFKHFVSPDHL